MPKWVKIFKKDEKPETNQNVEDSYFAMSLPKSEELLIDWIVFYAVSAISNPYNGGVNVLKNLVFCSISFSFYLNIINIMTKTIAKYTIASFYNQIYYLFHKTRYF